VERVAATGVHDLLDSERSREAAECLGGEYDGVVAVARTTAVKEPTGGRASRGALDVRGCHTRSGAPTCRRDVVDCARPTARAVSERRS